ncbi:hypothetical protein MN032_00315 [Agromyces atrinae]|uniref:hypothetical protein n=1 Tax=Agromyces atrinae TaxID=592376 RepID=UPI001F588C70|nr:hypothetical protein [Agromyces atrinae]MCI2956120.1 hypothetical protein [Agromyces atrinae]
MTTPVVPPKRRVSGFGIASLIVSALGLIPLVVVFLIGLIPDMMAIYWLLIVLGPFAAITALIATILGIIAVVLAARAHAPLALPITALLVGATTVVALSGIILGWFM